MGKGLGQRRAFAFLEYIVLLVVIIGCLIAFRAYIQRAHQGKTAASAESFAFGRQYDPRDTIACAYDDKLYIWYSEACFDHEYALRKCNASADSEGCQKKAMQACKAGCQVEVNKTN